MHGHTHTSTHIQGCWERGRGGGDNGASLNLQLPGGCLSDGLWKWSNHHNMPWKSLPLRLSPAWCWPPPRVGTFSSHLLCTWAKLHFIFLWGNLVLCFCPSQKVIYCQAGKYCSSHPRRALFSEMKHIVSYWAPACWDKQKSLKHFQPNPWRGKHIFQRQDSRLKKCVPHLFTKQHSSCSEALTPRTDRHLEDNRASQTVRSGCPSGGPHHHQSPAALELSTGTAQKTRLTFLIQLVVLFLLMLKKQFCLSTLQIMVKGKLPPALSPVS